MTLVNKQKPCHLLALPAEIRLQIYQHLFVADTPMPLHIDKSTGCIRPPTETSTYGLPRPDHCMSSQIISVCHQIYDEAIPILYGTNTFRLKEREIPTLSVLRLPPRLCIRNLEIKYSTGDFFSLPLLDECFPSLQKLDILCTKSIDALLLLTSLTKSLPCTQLRRWPRLELHALTPKNADFIELGNWEHFSTNLPPKQKDLLVRAIEKDPFHLSALHDLISLKDIGLEYAMPDLPLIRVHSKFTPKQIQAIKNHTCSVGDCHFFRQPVQSLPLPRTYHCECESKKAVSQLKFGPKKDDQVDRYPQEEYSVHRFRWGTRTGSHGEKGSNHELLSNIMVQYTPRLPSNLHQEMLNAGMQPSQPPDDQITRKTDDDAGQEVKEEEKHERELDESAGSDEGSTDLIIEPFQDMHL